jgi:hypothetical protein
VGAHRDVLAATPRPRAQERFQVVFASFQRLRGNDQMVDRR